MGRYSYSRRITANVHTYAFMKENKMRRMTSRWRQIYMDQLLPVAISFLTCSLSGHSHHSPNVDIQCCTLPFLWIQKGRMVLIWVTVVNSTTISQITPTTTYANPLSIVSQIDMTHWVRTSSTWLPSHPSTSAPSTWVCTGFHC